MKHGSYVPVAYLYPQKPPWRWKRIHTAFVVAFFFNAAFLVLLGWYAGAFAEETIYEVNLVNVIRNDGELKTQQAPQKRLTLDPTRPTVPSRRVGSPGGPAPAPGNKPENVHAKAPPPLKIDAPQVTPVEAPADPDAGMVSNAPPPPDASLSGNPEGVSGATGNEEGPGGTGTGGTGLGGTGNGMGNDGGFSTLVNRVHCVGCHQDGIAKGVEPIEIERLFQAVRWKSGGTPHLLTLGVTLNDQGYVKEAVVVVSTGNAEVDESAINLIRQSKWRPGRGDDGTPIETYVEMSMDVFY